MDLVAFICSWLIAFLALVICDYIWLGIVMKETIIEEFKPYIELKENQIQIKLGIGLLAWAIISLGCVYFVSFQSESLMYALLLGAFFGFILYGCYDLTNYTFFKEYSLKFVIIDILWGCVVCSIVSGAGFLAKRVLFGV